MGSSQDPTDADSSVAEDYFSEGDDEEVEEGIARLDARRK